MKQCIFFKPKKAYVLCISDWSSTVCSSDLRLRDRHRDPDDGDAPHLGLRPRRRHDREERGGDDEQYHPRDGGEERKSVVEGKRVSVRVDLGGSRIIKQNKIIAYNTREIRK